MKSLRSRRLALMLLILMACLATFGTIIPAEKVEVFYASLFSEKSLPVLRAVGLVETYRSPLFLGMIGLLSLNVVFCTWHRSTGFLRHGAREVTLKRRLHLVLDIVVHLSVVMIIGGGAGRALLGFIGTQNIHVGLSSDTVYHWKSGRDTPLGFTIAVLEREDVYYPLTVHLGIKDAGTGTKLGLLEIREGETGMLPGKHLEASLLEFDHVMKRLKIAVEEEGMRGEVVLEGQPGGKAEAVFGRYRIVLVAFREVLMTVRSRLAIREGGEVVLESWLAPNGRVGYADTSIFQTAWGEDRYGNRFVGLQVSRDPAAPVFWSGCVLLALALPLFLLVKHRR